MCKMIVPVLLKEGAFELAFICFTLFREVRNIIEERLIGVAVYKWSDDVDTAVRDVDGHIRSVLFDG